MSSQSTVVGPGAAAGVASDARADTFEASGHSCSAVQAR